MFVMGALLDSMESGQVDQEDVAVTTPDTISHIMQEVKGNKVLATPAVRRLALENKVSINVVIIVINYSTNSIKMTVHK